MRVVLGNRNAVQAVKKVVKGEIVDVVEDHPGKQATEAVNNEPDITVAKMFNDIVRPRGLWNYHTADVPTGEKDEDSNPILGDPTPAWVASDSKLLAALLADHFGGIEIRELDVNPGEGKPAAPARRRRNGGGAAAAAGTTLMLAVLLWLVAFTQPFLKTNAGNDFQAKQMGGAASATAVAKWMAVTANTTAPAAGDTSLTAEITTAGGGLVRAAGTYGHTTGAASYTISNTFTANGSDSLPVTLGKLGVFDAASAGNMPFTTLISPTATLSQSGDACTLTQTVTL